MQTRTRSAAHPLPLLLILCCALCHSPVAGQSRPEAPAAPASPPAPIAAPAPPINGSPQAPTNVPQRSAPTAANAPATGVEEVLKLARAGTSPAVLLAYVENSDTARLHRADDVLLLQTNGVPDEAIALMLKRGGAFRSKTVAGSQAVAMPAAVSALATDGRLDPESYEFWYYHYAYPRALHNAHAQLGPYQPLYTPYARGGSRHTGAHFDRGHRQVSPMGGSRNVPRR